MIPRRNRHPHPLIYLWGIKTSVYNVITCTGLKRQQLKNSGYFIVSQFVRFKMSPQTAHMSKFIVTLVTLFAFLHWTFSNVFSKCLHKRMQSHIGYICLSFLHCVFSNVPSKRPPEKMQSCIGCICWISLHCVFSSVSSNRLYEMTHNHIDCIYLT